MVTTSQNIELIKQKLATACRILVNEGATELGRGHEAYLLEAGRILIPGHLHDYGRTIADCTKEDVVTIDFDGKVLEGGYPESMGEFYMYTEIFRARKDVKAAVHAHPFYVGILGMTGKEMLLMSRDSFLFKDGIPVLDKLPLYVGTRELGRAVAEKLGNKRAVIHRGHGAIIVGRTIEEACVAAVQLEGAAKKQVLAYMVGEPLTYKSEDVEKCYGTVNRNKILTDWSYYVGRLRKTGTIV